MKTEYLATVDSTNRYLMDQERFRQDGDMVYTFCQTAGRGTRGRQWQEEPGKGLALSVLYHLPLACSQQLPLVCGLAVRHAVLSLYGLEIGLKWCNDVIAGGKKLGGILCESRITDGALRIVVGIGINLLYNQQEFDRGGLSWATSLALQGVAEPDGERLATTVRREVCKYASQLQHEGFSHHLREEYSDCCVTLAKPVEILYGDGRRIQGVAISIEPDGALLVDTGAQQLSIHSGDVSVRGLYGYVD